MAKLRVLISEIQYMRDRAHEVNMRASQAGPAGWSGSVPACDFSMAAALTPDVLDLVAHDATIVRLLPELRDVVREADLPPPPSEREFVSGETVQYLGRQFRLKVVETLGEEHTRIWAGWYEVPIPPGLAGGARRREVRRRLAGSLKEHADLYLPYRLADVCRLLRIEKPSLVVREQRKRWGSCNANGLLRINWRIIQAHIPLIEYVLVHELAHLGNRNHDRTFWDTVGQWLPDYERRRARLKELGPSLVW